MPDGLPPQAAAAIAAASRPAPKVRFACMGAWCAEGLRSICQHYHDVKAPQRFERACLSNRADEFVRMTGPVPTKSKT